MYLIQQHRKWWAYHDVPPSLREKVGRRRFTANLDTDDRDIAEIRAADLKARWLAEIKRAKTGAKQKDDDIYLGRHHTLADVDGLVAAFKAAFKKASPGERQKLVSVASDVAMDVAYDIDGVPNTHDEPDDPADERPGVQAGGQILEAAAGHLIGLTDHLEEYLATLNNEKKTVSERRRRIKEFADFGFPYIADVQRREVQKWINTYAKTGGRTKSGTALATLRRWLADLRGYWKYLQTISLAQEGQEPFHNLVLPSAGKDAKGKERLPFTPSEVLKLQDAARPDQQLTDLITLGMWTGARIEEMCVLKVKDVALKEKYIEIISAKTSAGRRQIPIHSKLMPTMRRLKQASKDGYVLSGLSTDGNGDRSGAVGKRFGRLKTAQGFGAQHVFHSIRKTVATMFENAGVLEGTAADILGHEKQTITYGLYSGGTSLGMKRTAIEKLAYKDD